ncbi:MAG: polar amino acid transport system substrate-binding protein [Chloroflexota bacterium]|jgi:polar amino acid transport system substrate-binding protein|nr:polar amino acid transport system substrate-binding protein [Chloroflexota bacterium]
MTGPKRTYLLLIALLAAGASVAACSSSTADPIPSGAALTCADGVAVKSPPKLTMSTNNPAVPPWWGGDPNAETLAMPAGQSGWTIGNPYSMEGFEGGVSASLSNALGYELMEVHWVPVSNEEALAPGSKPFDLHIAQVTVFAADSANVDISDPYYTSYEAVVGITGKPIDSATTLAALATYKLGAVAGSAGEAAAAAIVPGSPYTPFPDLMGAVEGLRAGAVDGLVVNVNVALYLRDNWHEGGDDPAPLPEGVIVGRFAPTTWTDEFVVLLEKGSPLTPCVNEAIDEIRRQGLINEYISEYIINSDSLPTFQ